MRGALKGNVSDRFLDEIMERVNATERDCISCNEVMEVLSETNRIRRNSIRSFEEENNGNDDILASPLNTTIPGGKRNLDEIPKFVYDSQTKSIRHASTCSA